jgi:hypothetical protein
MGAYIDGHSFSSYSQQLEKELLNFLGLCCKLKRIDAKAGSFQSSTACLLLEET